MKSKLPLLVGLLLAILSSAVIALEPPVETSATTVSRNVVLIITDDQNVDSLPVMRKMMAFPEGSWVNFTNAIANDPICCPARATLLTGQYSHHTGVRSNSAGGNLNDANTLPVWLDRAGYRTGLVGKYLNGFPWSKGSSYIPPGWDYFQNVAGRVDNRTKLGVEFIKSSTSPFFLYLAYHDPHNPAKPPTRYGSASVPIPPDPPNFNEQNVSDKPKWIRSLSPLSQSTIDTWRAERVASQRALLAVDDGVQQVVDALKAKGVLDNTLIMFLADHGFSWGSHRYYKKHCVYEECIKFPLLIRYPGIETNRTERRVVSNVDLVSTIGEFTGVRTGIPQDGRSLVPLITLSVTSWSEEALLEVHVGPDRRFYGIRTADWTYAEYGNGDKELYDLAADPYQLQNKANAAAYQAKQNELAERLRQLRGF
jgi:N-acetylglucosamine-6-sulfatase